MVFFDTQFWSLAHFWIVFPAASVCLIRDQTENWLFHAKDQFHWLVHAKDQFILLKKQQQFYTTGKLELDHINYKQVIAEIYKDSLQLINKEGTKKLKSSTRTLENFTSYSQGSEETVDIHSSYTRQKYMTLVILRTVNVTER